MVQYSTCCLLEIFGCEWLNGCVLNYDSFITFVLNNVVEREGDSISKSVLDFLPIIGVENL